MSNNFIHLHLHTEYSIVDGTVRIPQLIQRCIDLNQPAVAITDQTNLFGMVKFYRKAEQAGIKPIIGADLLVHDVQDESITHRLQLLCQNRTGYLNLCQLISRAYQEGQHRGIPHIRRHWLSQCNTGLIAISGAQYGDIGQALLNQHENKAQALLDTWQQDFPERFYIELQRTRRDQEDAYLAQALNLAVQTGVPVVATNDVRFLNAEDFTAHEARVCIHDGRLLADKRREQRYSQEQYLKSSSEMQELFADIPAALDNTVELAKRCNLELSFDEYYLPAFPTPNNESAEDFLQHASERGLQQRLAAHGKTANTTEDDYQARLEEELQVINSMGFPGYFLIVADFIRWAKNNQIPVGPGRGSGAGSLVAYSLGITDLDPLAYDLLFERFLNPERVSMPDFDVDFCMEKRDLVIDYVAHTYGRDQVSQIITYGSMAAKAVVRDCGRVLGHGYGFVDSIAKLIPLTLGITLQKALAEEPELKRRYDEEEDTRAILDLALQLEGLTRNAGKHAGGVVIAPSKLTDFAPLFCEADVSGVVTQFDKDDVETIGLVKFDFLGLRTLTIIDWAVRNINAQRKSKDQPLLVLEQLPLDDKKTYALLQSCQTTAVFQLESRGMKDLVRRMQPSDFEDIVALLALFRPGPLQSGMVDDFIDRKSGKASIQYPHPALAPILKPTYGVILYQEQVMQIAQELAGYTLGGADLLRRAMGKKKPEEMAKQRKIFVDGAHERGVDYGLADSIFDLMETFAGYGFNKSHSAAYALIAFQTAYLKAHYPAAFMAAVLSSDMDNTDKVAIFIEECRHMDLPVLPPDINQSQHHFTVTEETQILYGLGAIKGVGKAAIDLITENLQQHGPFKDLLDFCNRLDLQKVNRRVSETLIRSGAMDGLEPTANRAALLHSLPDTLQAAEQTQRNRESGQSDMFGAPAPDHTAAVHSKPVAPWHPLQRLQAERDALGLYLTGHPMQLHADDLKCFTTCRLVDLTRRVPENPHRHKRSAGMPMVLAGMISTIRRRNERGAFVALEDGSGRLEVALYDEAFTLYSDLLSKDEIIVVEGNVSADDFSGGYRMNARQVMSLSQAKSFYAKGVHISIKGPQNNLSYLLETTFAPYRNGHSKVIVDYRNQRAFARLQLGEEWTIKPCEELVAALNQLDGISHAKLFY